MAHDSYHHGDLRAALVAAGLELIREVGAEGFTLREVARRSNVSHAAPYRHFRDKSELTAAIAEEGFTLLAAEMRRAAKAAGTPRQRLVRAGRAYVHFALRRPEHFKVMFAARLDAERHPAARRAADDAFAGLVSLVVACQEAKQLRDLPRLTVARIAWAQVHGIATLASGGQFQLQTRAAVLAFAEQAMESLIEGLR
ncbi:MAG TPA: TetR/AcrR family transcriptional regulator [Thermoanaerobaculia bacterium]|nr:TetR/AcrR family transcriptional regulator [Thermoanaerobaculia bacterium]